jgi:type II secretory pathway component PulF
MTLFRRLRTDDLIELCRSLRFSLHSGIMLGEAMDLLAHRGTRRVRLFAADIHKELKSGWSLQDALRKQKVLPPLFASLAIVGEESGKLPEVLAEMETYYILQQKLRREFYEQIAWPVLQLTAAILIVTFLIYILGILPQTQSARGGQAPLDPLGLGLVGPRGAGIFLATVCGILTGAALVVFLARILLSRRAVVERMLLMLPGVGPCLRALAISRFCIAGRLMLETSLSVLKTLRLALAATDNAAFIAEAPRVEASLRKGNSIVSSFGEARLFPERFLSAVGVGEESGRLPETLRHQAEEYDDEARRRLTWLTRVSSWLVWLAVAAILITCIIRIFSAVYVGTLQGYMPK